MTMAPRARALRGLGLGLPAHIGALPLDGGGGNQSGMAATKAADRGGGCERIVDACRVSHHPLSFLESLSEHVRVLRIFFAPALRLLYLLYLPFVLILFLFYSILFICRRRNRIRRNLLGTLPK